MGIVSHPIPRKPLPARSSYPSEAAGQEETDSATLEKGHVAGAEDLSVELRIADTRDVLFNAFGLVYDVYLQCRLTRPNAHGMRITPHHLLPTTDVFVAIRQGRVVCTMSLVRDGSLGLPMETTYGAEVERRRMQGSTLAEVSCLAGDLDAIDSTRQPAIRLMGFMAQHAWRCGVDELLIAVHPDQASFYERLIAFEPIGGKRRYLPVCNQPAIAMALNLTRAAADYPRLYRRFFKKLYPEAMFHQRPLSGELLEEMRQIAGAADLVEPATETLSAVVPA